LASIYWGIIKSSFYFICKNWNQFFRVLEDNYLS
jgi:hypothetical protein